MAFASVLVALLAAPVVSVEASTVTIDGRVTTVAWNDGDSFAIKDGPLAGERVRLGGFNALESYGPVHSWGQWQPQPLYELTKTATEFARSKSWKCDWGGKRDGYGRLLITCPVLVIEMVQRGYAHVFAVEGDPDPVALEAQIAALASGAGMWAKGVPAGLITSLHSADEKRKGKSDNAQPYNRIADPKTGRTRKHEHSETYATCQKVCMHGSCMVYVPFTARYGKNRADCLRTKGSLRNKSVK